MIQSPFTITYLAVARAIELASGRICRGLRRDERGQASAEYALVLLGAALLALFLGKWVMQADTMKNLFQNILDRILGDMP